LNTIFNHIHKDEILKRIGNLSIHSQPKWGKMNVAQMLSHCSSFQDVAMGYSTPKRSWLGQVVGGFAKPIFYNDKPLPKNLSTIPEMVMTDEKDFELEREQLTQKINAFHKNGAETCTRHPHPFFGKLTSEQWGKGIYKHLDHHLKQFGV
jgi:hypothetical protein